LHSVKRRQRQIWVIWIGRRITPRNSYRQGRGTLIARVIGDDIFPGRSGIVMTGGMVTPTSTPGWRKRSSPITLLTTAPGLDVAPIHDRQMVILERVNWKAWLDLTRPEAGAARALDKGTDVLKQSVSARRPAGRW
jgi:hypothetical protein